jgi:UPF0716 protein FxsA
MVLLIFLFIVVPILELAVIIQVGEAIGVWWTIGLLLFDSLLGAYMWRSQGGAAWRRFNTAVAEHRPPTREVLDGVLIIFGGALLITPGFISDFFGLILLIPPTRALVRGFVVRRVMPRTVRAGYAGFTGFASRRNSGSSGRGFAGSAGPGFDVEGSATEIPPDPPRLPS